MMKNCVMTAFLWLFLSLEVWAGAGRTQNQTVSLSAGKLHPESLRTEYLVDPLGIDTVKPRMSWVLRAADDQDKKLKQSAYRVLVASTPELLSKDQGDLWDSGKVVSGETLGIEYAGKNLQSRDRCYWKVNVWDGEDKPSAWSQTALWTMGLLKPEDWQAKWIAAALPDPVLPQNAGYHSDYAKTAGEIKWVQVDLGSRRTINKIVLHPAFPVFQEKARRAADYFYPMQFKIEAADREDFSDARILFDQTKTDVPRPNKEPQTVRFPALEARYVRLTATKLSRTMALPWFAMALAEMGVYSGEENVALKAAVKASDELPDAYEKGWASGNLTDGQTGPDGGTVLKLRPAPMFRKEFLIEEKAVRQATLRATALGIYVASINGKRVSEDWFAPGLNQMDEHTRYQTYDITGLVKSGGNVAGVMLGDGWYRQRPVLGGYSPRELNLEYGGLSYDVDGILRFYGQIEIEYTDGSRQIIPTDGSWQTFTDGPVRKNRMFDGVDYDARKELPGWDSPGFRINKGWINAEEKAPLTPLVMSAQMNQAIRVIEEWKPTGVKELRPGVWIYSFPTHVTGVCRVKIQAPEGTTITLRHGQALNPDGSLMTSQLIGAVDNRDIYICKGSGVETFLPEFTFHGFQHMELSGVTDIGAIQEVTAIAVSDDLPQLFKFESSDQRLNQLWKNMVRSYYDNFKSVIADASARDERGAFQTASTIPSYAAIFDGAAFSRRQLENLRIAQLSNSLFTVHAPATKMSKAHSALSGAGAVNLWAPWVFFAQERLLEENYEAFKQFMESIRRLRCPKELWEPINGVGVNDWLDAYMSDPPGQKNTQVLWHLGIPHPHLPLGLTRMAYLYRWTRMMVDLAEAMGKKDDAAEYARWSEGIRSAFCREFVREDGTVTGDIQASYALVLGFDLIDDPEVQQKAMSKLLRAIDTFYDGHISTGVRATYALLEALSKHGQQDLAYKLAMQPTYPSYGYMVDQGATTVWERWDGYIPGRGYRSDLSHSESLFFGQWVIERIAGIRPDPKHPGFKHFFIEPQLFSALTSVNASYDSVRGRIESSYKIENGRMNLNVLVPPNTTATVKIPVLGGMKAPEIREGTTLLSEAEGVRVIKSSAREVTCQVQAGSYSFSYDLSAAD